MLFLICIEHLWVHCRIDLYHSSFWLCHVAFFNFYFQLKGLKTTFSFDNLSIQMVHITLTSKHICVCMYVCIKVRRFVFFPQHNCLRWLGVNNVETVETISKNYLWEGWKSVRWVWNQIVHKFENYLIFNVCAANWSIW